MKIAVIGGGISGLAAAWELREQADVTVFEAARLGGRILTTPFRDRPVDEGPDAFLTRVPDAVRLCEELGIGGELVAPAEGRSAVWFGDRLRVLPEGLVLGVPRDLAAVARGGLLSPIGIGRAALDLILPRRRPVDGLTVREMVADRLGVEVADRLVDPLVGGIHAGWTGALGADEVTPQIAAVARRSRSLIVGLRSVEAPANSGPVFLAPLGGMEVLVRRLTDALIAEGVTFRTQQVERVTSVNQTCVLVDGDPSRFDAAVLAVPARTASSLLGRVAAAELESIPTASVAIVTASVTSPLPDGLNGFLVPRGQGRLMTACSFGSNKWPHWATPGEAVVRISSGRYGDAAALELEDEALATRLLDELGEALGRSVSATEYRVSRWPDSFPQYAPGHSRLVEEVERSLAESHPRVALAGSSYWGSGIPACIASGRRSGRSLIGRLQVPGGAHL